MTNVELSVNAGPLAQPCQAVLVAEGLVSSDTLANGVVHVFTKEGDLSFSVIPTISPIDLLAFIVHGRMSGWIGQETGRRHLADSLHALLGAATAA